MIGPVCSILVEGVAEGFAKTPRTTGGTGLNSLKTTIRYLPARSGAPTPRVAEQLGRPRARRCARAGRWLAGRPGAEGYSLFPRKLRANRLLAVFKTLRSRGVRRGKRLPTSNGFTVFSPSQLFRSPTTYVVLQWNGSSVRVRQPALPQRRGHGAAREKNVQREEVAAC